MLVGVDIGGTFTDLVLSADGRLVIHKLLSTPHDPAEAMLAGLESITPGGLAALRQVAHGSTVATNAILERKGARTALITTQGFRDLLFIGRQDRPALYALQPALPPPLVPRRWCYEVPERLDPTGAVVTPLDLQAFDRVLDDMAAQGVEAAAVCFLYSFVNPAHEQAVRARILERGLLQDRQIALSCEVLPEFREYERASTVVLDAYVRPVMSRYLQRLEDRLPPGCGLRVMKSDGGVVSAARARQQAVQTALSGPAAGVIGAFYLARLAGFDQIITLDIGGTSTDVALCPGAPVRRPESVIDGLPLRIRLLDIETIGAGGGSIARLDAGGALRVGPESAGADPGPIIYGRGGREITVSDAHAVLGRLDAAHFLGGRMALDAPAAQAALAALADRLGATPAAAAQGIVEVANASIDRALRRVSVARGHDPRGFTLAAFGGAGPLHACEVAARLDIPRVLIPRHPGVLCAFGLLAADIVLDFQRSVLEPVGAHTPARLAARAAAMMAEAQAGLEAEGVPPADRTFNLEVEMRYQGQAYELAVPWDETADAAALAQAFHRAHARAYGHALPGRTVEVVNLRLQAVGLTSRPALTPEPLGPPAADSARLADTNRCACYDRERLAPGMTFAGPALVFQFDSTIYVAPGWTARVDAYHNLVLTREAG